MIWALKILKISTLTSSFYAKYITFGLSKYKRVILHDSEEWSKIRRKTDLWFEKWHEEYGKFSPEHLKDWKLGLSWNCLVQYRKCMSLNFTDGLCIMKMKNDAKFEEELTCHFKIDLRNLTNFDPEHSNVSKIGTLIGSFWPK